MVKLIADGMTSEEVAESSFSPARRPSTVTGPTCCEECAAVFSHDPDHLLGEISDVVVCPTRLTEKHFSQTVEFELEGALVRLCRCSGCAEAFRNDGDRFLGCLAL